MIAVAFLDGLSVVLHGFLASSFACSQELWISLSQIISDGSVFVCEFPLFDNIVNVPDITEGNPSRKMWKSMSPIAVFVSRPSPDGQTAELIPTAIQMDSKPGTIWHCDVKSSELKTNRQTMQLLRDASDKKILEGLPLRSGKRLSFRYCLRCLCTVLERKIKCKCFARKIGGKQIVLFRIAQHCAQQLQIVPML